MWWPYRFRDAAGAADPTDRVRAFSAAVATGTFVEASARTPDGGVDVWFRSNEAPSEACGAAWLEGLRANGLVVERLKGRN